MDLPNLKVITQGGGKLTEAMWNSLAQYAKDKGKQFIATYGQSECTARMAYLPAEMAMDKVCSIGVAEPGGQLSIIDDNGDDLSGSIADEIKYIMDETGCGFCFDFSHAICAAISHNINIDTQLKNFFDLNPTVYHMCDGDLNIAEDKHLHFGEGNYPLKHFLNDFTANDAYITMETGGFSLHNDLSIKDYEYIKSI